MILNFYNICQSSSEHECYIKYNHVPSCFRNLIIILHAKYSLFSNNFRPCLFCIAVFSLPVVYIRDSGTRVTIKVPRINRMYNIQLSLGLKSLASALNTNRPLHQSPFTSQKFPCLVTLLLKMGWITNSSSVVTLFPPSPSIIFPSSTDMIGQDLHAFHNILHLCLEYSDILIT